MTFHLAFSVLDLPRPQGSKRHIGKGVVIESGGENLATWREAVKQAALNHLDDDHQPHDGPIALNVSFHLPRPKGHYKIARGVTSADLRDSAPSYPHKIPDLDKLLRSSMDALTAAGVWRDDAQVVAIRARKFYCDRSFWATPGARFDICEATP